MDPISIGMLVGSIGIQFFNNYKNSKKNAEIRRMQQEFKKASDEHDFTRMRRIQEESIRLNQELEHEAHEQRLEEIRKSYNDVVNQLANTITIEAWPLSVLPFIMKGESFGGLINGGVESASMHCIFTPSNYDEFNRLFYSDLDFRLEAEMNNVWNAQSSHPIVYYGGCWRRYNRFGVPDIINTNDIDLLETQLGAIPTLVITPYFSPSFYFKIRTWGMGKNTEIQLVPNQDTFSYEENYEKGKFPKDEIDDFYETTIEEFVPFLRNLIGFVADAYFWEMYRQEPMLPASLDGRPLLPYHIEGYKKLLLDTVSPSGTRNTEALHQGIVLYKGLSQAITKEDKLQLLWLLKDKALSTNNECLTFEDIENFKELSFLLKDECIAPDSHIEETLKRGGIIRKMQTEFIELSNYDLSEGLSIIKERLDKTAGGNSFVYKVWNASIIIGTICNESLTPCFYEEPGTIRMFVFYSNVTSYLPSDSSRIYLFNYINNSNCIMEKSKDVGKFEKLFAEAGGNLGKGLDGLISSVSSKKSTAKSDSVWGDEPNRESDSVSIGRVVNFFVENAGKSIPAKHPANMSLQDVLNWIDETVLPSATKVYLVKSFVKQHNKFIICAFYANETAVFLGEKDPKVCFIAPVLTEEISNSFQGNDICTIPLK